MSAFAVGDRVTVTEESWIAAGDRVLIVEEPVDRDGHLFLRAEDGFRVGGFKGFYLDEQHVEPAPPPTPATHYLRTAQHYAGAPVGTRVVYANSRDVWEKIHLRVWRVAQLTATDAELAGIRRRILRWGPA